MIKKTIKYFLYFLILITIGIFYLSYYGIETQRFNQAIKDKISETNNKIDIELNKVKIVLNLGNFNVDIKTINPNIIFENNKIKLEKIVTDFSIGSFFKKEFAIKSVKISTKENSLKNIIRIAKIYKNTPQLFILNKMVKGGLVIADINLNFDENGKLSNNYNVKGSVKDGKIKLLNKKNVNNISLNFNIKEKLCLDIYNKKIRHDGICITITEPHHNSLRVVHPPKNGEYIVRKLSMKEHYRLMGFNDDEFNLNGTARRVIITKNESIVINSPIEIVDVISPDSKIKISLSLILLFFLKYKINE